MKNYEVRVGRFALQPFRQLQLGETPIVIGRKALDILSTLAAANGRVVTKSELMDVVWPGLTVEENAIQVHVVALRKVLGDDAYLLNTVRGIGYRLDIGGTEESHVDNLHVRNSVAVLPFVNMTGDGGVTNLQLCLQEPRYRRAPDFKRAWCVHLDRGQRADCRNPDARDRTAYRRG
jgi:DNA-binding winged helix-turn-helix (wHTH) protein